MSGSWAGFENLRRAVFLLLPGRGHRLAWMVATEVGGAVVQEHLHRAKLLGIRHPCHRRVRWSRHASALVAGRRSGVCGPDGRIRRWPSSCSAATCHGESAASAMADPRVGGPGPRWRPAVARALDLGVGEHIPQGPQPLSGPLRDCASPARPANPLISPTARVVERPTPNSSPDDLCHIVLQVNQRRWPRHPARCLR